MFPAVMGWPGSGKLLLVEKMATATSVLGQIIVISQLLLSADET
jgi:hypothetical protein